MSIRVVSSRMVVRATAGRRSRSVVTCWATVSSLVSSVTTRTFSAGVTCSVTAGRFSKPVATCAATSSSRVRSATAWTFSSTVTGRSTRWPTTRFAPSGVQGYRHSCRLNRALATAYAAVQAAAQAVYADYECRLDELAEDLLASGKLDQATGAGPRRILAADFLTERSGGYPPLGRTLTLLLARPQLKPGKNPPPSAPPLPLT